MYAHKFYWPFSVIFGHLMKVLFPISLLWWWTSKHVLPIFYGFVIKYSVFSIKIFPNSLFGRCCSNETRWILDKVKSCHIHLNSNFNNMCLCLEWIEKYIAFSHIVDCCQLLTTAKNVPRKTFSLSNVRLKMFPWYYNCNIVHAWYLVNIRWENKPNLLCQRIISHNFPPLNSFLTHFYSNFV